MLRSCMRRLGLLPATALHALAIAAAQPLTAQAPVRVSWSVRDAAVPSLRPGAEAVVTLIASITPEWHMYSLTQPTGGPIALHFSVPAGEPFVLAGEATGPQPEIKSDATFGIAIELYSGDAEFRVPLRLAAAVRGDVVVGRIVARYQTCSETICLPPRSITLRVRLKERPSPGATP